MSMKTESGGCFMPLWILGVTLHIVAGLGEDVLDALEHSDAERLQDAGYYVPECLAVDRRIKVCRYAFDSHAAAVHALRDGVDDSRLPTGVYHGVDGGDVVIVAGDVDHGEAARVYSIVTGQ